MRIDIHVHSKYSRRPSQWILKKIGCPESFTEPLQLYRIAKSRGMSHVTISDHNSIDGALEIAHLNDVFISEEITTYFPESGCKIHVLALNINETQHGEIQRLRGNIFELAGYLHREHILAIAAHPLYAINDRLTTGHFEQLLLLFQYFELNGARNPRENECLRYALQQLTEAHMSQLAERHGLAPLFERSWEKKLWGGSDDHSSLHIARTYTTIQGIEHPRQLTADCRNLVLEVTGEGATPLTMGHNLYGIAYQYYRSKFNLERYADKDALMRFLDRNLLTDANSHPGWVARLYLLWQYRKEKRTKAAVSDSLLTLLRHESWELIQEEAAERQADSMSGGDFTQREQRWFDFVNRSSKRVMLHFGNHLLDHLSGANLFNVFSTIGSAGGLYTLLAPYFVAYAQFSKDRGFSERVRHLFSDGVPKTEQLFKFAHFTDTYYEVNGVAQTLQQQVRFALKNDKDYTLITCNAHGQGDPPGVRNFEPIGTYELPEYPEQKIFYPPVLDMLAYCYDQRIAQIHSATPGPVGLAALAIARILKLPISGTYHTAIPQYAQILTGDEGIADLAWKYVLWYYDQMDVIYAPSQSTRDELVAKGINPAKVRVYPRGIDIERFHPSKRNGIFKKQYHLGDGIKMLYVGRISREKNLHLLAQAFEGLMSEGYKAQLVVVGDGPYLAEMKARLEGKPCCFTGYLQGEVLDAVYASSDLFVFPSATDTFGNVVLEAQAAGIPVIVSNQGGPCENIIDGRTGLVCQADDVKSLQDAVRTMLDSPGRRRAMGLAARRYLEERSFESAFLNLWEQYQEPMPVWTAYRAAG